MTYENWTAAGSSSMEQRAHAKVKKLIAEHKPKELDPAVRKQIEEIVRKGY